MMEPLSSSPCSNEHKAQKRPIAFITIESHDDDIVNEVFSSSAVKRGKNETTTERIKDESSTSAVSLKEDGDIEEELHDFSVADVSNAANLTRDGNAQLNENLVQNVMKEQSLADDETSGEHFDALNDSETCINNNSNEIIKAPKFVLEPTSTGNIRLVVFVSIDKTMCYKFYKKPKSYHCQNCWKAHNKTVAAKVLRDESGEDYVQMVHQHLCEPVKYTPPRPAIKREIINVPNFVLETTTTRKKRLVVFVADDKTMCYEFYKKRELYRSQKCLEAHKKTVAAKVLKDENGDDYVQMVHPHLCKPVNYVSQSQNIQIQQHEIINASNYEIQLTQNGKRVLVIFLLTNPNICYYYRNKVKDYFVCCQCENNKKTISAKLLTDKEGTQYVQANVRHICEPVPYVANKWSSNIIQ